MSQQDCLHTQARFKDAFTQLLSQLLIELTLSLPVPDCTHVPALSINVLTNPAMPDVVKIGMTNRDTIDARMKELFHTSVTLPFEYEYACNVVDRENKPVKLP